jgi:Vitamin K epoxide reductase family
LASFALAIVGLMISVYLTYEHFTGAATKACLDTGTVNCVKMTTSPWSVIAGIPVAIAALAYYAAMTLLFAARAAGDAGRADDDREPVAAAAEQPVTVRCSAALPVCAAPVTRLQATVLVSPPTGLDAGRRDGGRSSGAGTRPAPHGPGRPPVRAAWSHP